MKRSSTLLLIVAGWSLFTIALAVWWAIFAYGLVEELQRVAPQGADLLARRQRMLIYEGATLVVLLVAGGLALGSYVWREASRNRQLKDFFAAFSHDLKTPIASVRLQAESLQEDLRGQDTAKLADRLRRDTVRLELQLENSLFLANLEELGQLHMEPVTLDQAVRSLRQSWPDLEIQQQGEGVLQADPRALDTVLKNLVMNATQHGKATAITLSLQPAREGRVELTVADNGLGFQGRREVMGRPFARHGPSSGSGIGLYLVQSLMRRMQGQADFDKAAADRGFIVGLNLPGSLQ